MKFATFWSLSVPFLFTVAFVTLVTFAIISVSKERRMNQQQKHHQHCQIHAYEVLVDDQFQQSRRVLECTTTVITDEPQRITYGVTCEVSLDCERIPDLSYLEYDLAWILPTENNRLHIPPNTELQYSSTTMTTLEQEQEEESSTSPPQQQQILNSTDTTNHGIMIVARVTATTPPTTTTTRQRKRRRTRRNRRRNRMLVDLDHIYESIFGLEESVGNRIIVLGLARCDALSALSVMR